ncbi:uracil-xanthine permease family protein [Halocalculus aciditolerans]|uniref:Xanthine permease n=1 Tax=Halocalculus aciditolerans TaxID=1383812 RepID=A0A830FB25_9EURY|nr:solute carrier family 23 protein [Halocalculus aciditolerans]GGL57349.1 xanthine permease [Halocalculus aciditolerans]
MAGDETPPDGLSGEPGTESVASDFVEYGIDDKPPLVRSLLLGSQHYLTMIGANIAVPLILASAMGMPAWATAQLVGTFFVVSGIATLAQTTFGNRYPIVQGASFSIMAPALAVIGVMATSGAGWETMVRELQGAVLVAAAAEMLIGYLGLVGRLKRYLSPVVVAPTIALIGLALFNVSQITSGQQNWWIVGLTVLLIVAFSQYLDVYHRAFKLYPVLIGVVVAWVAAAVLSAAGVFGSGDAAYVSARPVADASLFVVPGVLVGQPLFTPAYIVGIFAGFMASVLESFGDYHAVARIAGVGAPSRKRIDHGIGMEGLMSIFSGFMGTGNGCTSYSENIGAIGLTGVASRYVVQIGAALMLVVGFVGYFGALVTTIPDAVVGGLFIAMFGQIAAVGLSNLKYVDLDSSRNIFIIGISLFAGLAIPNYMSNVGSAAAFQEGLSQVAVLGPVLGVDVIAQTVYVVGGVGMAVGGLIAFVLDNTIAGTDEERGLTQWSELAEEDGAFQSAYDRFVKSD